MPDFNRRQLIGRGVSLGALTMLTGCDISDQEDVQRALHAISRWNDRVQAAIFSRQRLAPQFAERDAVKDFRYNAWYGRDQVPRLSADTYKLELAGLITDKRPWTVDQLHALPQVTQITRHVCVEGWNMIGKWTGTPLHVFLEKIGADTSAKYVGYECADGYYEGMDMQTALQPQTMMAFKLADEVIPFEHGYPFKIRIPTKLGFKNPKFVTTLYVTNTQPRGFWPDRGYNWFSGI